MNAAKTVSAILSKPWLIQRDYVENNLPLIMSILDGSFVSWEDDRDDEEERSQPFTGLVSANAGVNIVQASYRSWTKQDLYSAPKGSIALITIDHPITKHNNCGDMGSLAFAELIAEIDTLDNISGVILNIDSPGGMVSGTQTAANSIANSTTPIFAYINDGIAASAAYWYASQADKIYVSHKTDMVGSIGAYISFLDVRGYFEKMGAKLHEVYSRLSSEKNKPFLDARDDKYDELQDELDFIVNQFISDVKAKRSIDTSAGDPFKGAMYFAEEAEKIGLIDGIRTFEQVVTEMSNLSEEGTTYYV